MTHKAAIAVLGAGLMGHGIAQVFATAGFEVAVYDPAPEPLSTLRSRIAENLLSLEHDARIVERVHGTQDLGAAVSAADFIVEAALEDLEVKRELLARVEDAARSNAILASNTSVMPITEIMRGLKNKARALGTHWWNPPFLIPLVEVVGTDWTEPEVVDSTMSLLAAAGKMPVRVNKDVPGFIGNRLQHALWREAIALVEEGICDAATVDIVVKASFGRRLGVLGPLENADLVGTDLTLAIHRTVLPAIDCRPGPSPYLEVLVADGKLGMKAGEGFMRWTQAAQADVRKRLFAALKRAM